MTADFFCEKPLDLRDMTVDHILPEWLSEHPVELKELCQEYNIHENFPQFQINDFANWVPAHPIKCNVRKGDRIFPKRMTLLLLEDVQRRLRKVRQELEAISQSRKISHVLGSLGTAIENERLTVREVREFIEQIEKSQYAGEPMVLTFGLMIEDVLDSDDLPHDVSREYPYLCDWLELDLVSHLRTIITTPFHYTQPSERWGDGLSVRIVFPNLNDVQLEKFNLPWWEILEAGNFWEIFGERYEDAFPDLPDQEYFGNLES